jgi:hypothetical protein
MLYMFEYILAKLYTLAVTSILVIVLHSIISGFYMRTRDGVGKQTR